MGMGTIGLALGCDRIMQAARAEPPGETMRVILDVLQGPRKGRTFIFDRHDMFIVGRSRFVHCPMPEDSALSRDHFLIEINPPRCDLRDLGSTNGTFVNERRVDRVRLNSGDRIAAGQSIFQVRVEGSYVALKEEGAAAGKRLESRTETMSIGPNGTVIRCAGCGSAAPPDIDVANPAAGEAVEWLCDYCRSEVAVLPQPVPHYTTLRELGRGAMGIVYQARHNQTGQLVALKLIVPETATTRSAVDRFLREMSVISQLKHPNIVEFLEQGMTRGQFWFAMEYVIGGDNLEECWRAGRVGHLLRSRKASPHGLSGCSRKGLEQRTQERVRASRHQKPEEYPDRPPAGWADRMKISRLRSGQEDFRGLGLSEHDLLGRDAGDGPVHAAGADARPLETVLRRRRPLRHPPPRSTTCLPASSSTIRWLTGAT